MWKRLSELFTLYYYWRAKMFAIKHNTPRYVNNITNLSRFLGKTTGSFTDGKNYMSTRISNY